MIINLLSELFPGSQISAGVVSKTQRGVLIKLISSTVGQNPEFYHLAITKDSINLEASTQEGIFRGIQTMKQLQMLIRGKLVFQGCIIDDWPVFKIRGFMQDVGRNYKSLSLLKEQIDVIAAYNFNVFHFHMTDNPGWRLESKIHFVEPDRRIMQPCSRGKNAFYSPRRDIMLVER